MNETIPVHSLVDDTRKVVVNGRRYYTMTAAKCTTCSGDGHFMYLKQRHTGGSVTIECPNCDYYITIREEMLQMNLDK